MDREPSAENEIAATRQPVQRILAGYEGFSYITNQTRGDDFEDYLNMIMVMKDIPCDVLDAVSELRQEWAAEANSPISLGLEKYIAEMLHLPYAYYDSSRPVQELSATQKRAAWEIYEVTQFLLGVKEVDAIVLFRGVGWSSETERRWIPGNLSVGQGFSLTGRILSSWSFDRSVAEAHMRKYTNGYLLESVVPIRHIFAIMDLDYEQESVCIFNAEAVVVAVHRREGAL